ncbi:MAG: hypothetical protein EAZ92_13165 [Candidatus Kapaibacterium sp.]|nr:MAG: hypothetical protein EAZ92_13165 [Candidatus Kapabacteria bacterium]
MTTITVREAAQNLPTLIQSVINDFDETVIVGDAGAVVMIPQISWNEIQETLRLLNDPISLQALLDGQRERERTGQVRGKSPEEVFHDV